MLYNVAGDGEQGREMRTLIQVDYQVHRYNHRNKKNVFPIVNKLFELLSVYIFTVFKGNVTLLTQSIYMSKCTIDVTYYPFDAQMCELKFASWSTEVTRVSENQMCKQRI